MKALVPSLNGAHQIINVEKTHNKKPSKIGIVVFVMLFVAGHGLEREI